MMIASSPFVPTPAAGATPPGNVAAGTTVTAFTVTLQGLAPSGEGTLTTSLAGTLVAPPGLNPPAPAAAGGAAPQPLTSLLPAIAGEPLLASAPAEPGTPILAAATQVSAAAPEIVLPAAGDAQAPDQAAASPLPAETIEPIVDSKPQATPSPAAPAGTVIAQIAQPAAKPETSVEAGPKKTPKPGGGAPVADATTSPAAPSEPATEVALAALAAIDAAPASVASAPSATAAPATLDPAVETNASEAEMLIAAAATPAAPTPAPAEQRTAVRADTAFAVDTGSATPSQRVQTAAVQTGAATEATLLAGETKSVAAEATMFTLAAGPAPEAAAESQDLPASLVGQTIAPAPARPISAQHIYPMQAPPAGTVTAQPGRIGREMGVEIARRISAGQEEMLIRLNPQEMGRIEVRLSFDESGAVRAVLASESPAALEMLRRDTGDLARSLADAGVRSDSQSFRFDRGGGDLSGQRGQNGDGGQQGRRDGGFAFQNKGEDEQDVPAYRQLRGSGQVNLIA